jgi:ribonuclease BN (tRNA processing enzyme)
MPATQLVFLGTGTAFQEDGRGSAGLLLRVGAGNAILVDVGPTSAAALARARIAPACIDRLLVTHLHGDHTAGWPFLLLHFVFRERRTAPFHVHGPRGTREALEALSRLCYREVEDRRAFDIVYDELAVASFAGRAAGAVARFDGIPMDHHPTSIGYRIAIGEHPHRRCVGITGDTRWCPGLEDLSRGVDLLVAECTNVARGPDPHLSLAEIREGRARLAAERVVLVHLTDAVAESLALDPVPGVAAAHDGLVLDL